MRYCHKLSYPKFHQKFTKVDKTPNTILHTVPITPPNTPSKGTSHNIISKRPVSNTQQSNFKRMRKTGGCVQISWWNRYAELLTADCN